MKRKLTALLLSFTVATCMLLPATSFAGENDDIDLAASVSEDAVAAQESVVVGDGESQLAATAVTVTARCSGYIYIQGDAGTSFQITQVSGTAETTVFDKVLATLDENSTSSYYYAFVNAGTYKVYGNVKATFYSLSKEQTVATGTLYYIDPSSDTSGTSGKEFALEDQYIKFTAKYTGYVSVATYYAKGTIQLLSSGKAARSNAVKPVNAGDSEKSTIVFGVNKGTAYYIKYTPEAEYSHAIGLLLTNKSITEKSGSSKSAAKTVSRSKLIAGTLTAGSTRADWYKFKCTRSSAKITVNAWTNNAIKVYVCHKVGKKTKTWPRTLNRYANGYRYLNLSLSGNCKGTWYVKVYRGNSYSSGYYTLKWK